MDTDHLLMAYADGELDEAAAREVKHRIAVDPRARARVELYWQTASLLRSACGEAAYAPRMTFPPPARTGPSRRQLGLACAASVGIGLAGFGLGRVLPGDVEPDLLSEVAEYHAVVSRETTHLVEVPADQVEEVARWIAGRVARRLAPPDLAAASLRFAGVRLLVFNGHPVADLLYTREHGMPVALCIVRLAGHAETIRLARRAGLQLATWRDGGNAYVVAGELDERAAQDIAERAAVSLRL